MRLLLFALAAVWLAAPAAHAQDDGGRPQGDNPQTGTAVPRVAPPATVPPPPTVAPPTTPPPSDGPRAVGRSRRTITVRPPRTVVVQPPPVYGYPYYSPYGGFGGHYPYGYGSFGLGFLYYDPYRWHPGAGYYQTYPYDRRSYSAFDIGELRLDVAPRHAQVFIDGYYAGVVDDYDGAFQAIRLAPGAYRVDLVAPGYETLTFDVRITPGQKIRYRGDLILNRRP
jgi:hypothetical protein